MLEISCEYFQSFAYFRYLKIPHLLQGTTVPEESNDSMDSALANKENLTANSNGTSDVDEDSRASFNIQEDTNDSVPASEPASEATSEVPSDIGMFWITVRPVTEFIYCTVID